MVYLSLRRQDIENLSTLLAFCDETHQSTLGSPHKEPMICRFDALFVVTIFEQTVELSGIWDVTLMIITMCDYIRPPLLMILSRKLRWSGYCSASGGSFWDRPPGCACLFWIQSGRGLDCSTSLPRGGLDLSQQSPNRRKVGLWNSLVGGRRYVTLAKWVTEVGHWLDWFRGLTSLETGTRQSTALTFTPVLSSHLDSTWPCMVGASGSNWLCSLSISIRECLVYDLNRTEIYTCKPKIKWTLQTVGLFNRN